MPCTVYISATPTAIAAQLTQFLEEDERFIVTSDEQASIRVLITGHQAEDAVLTVRSMDEQIELPAMTTTRATFIGLLSMLAKGLALEAQVSGRLMKKMSSVVAHDVRNPLNNILLATAQFKLDTPPDADEAAMYIDIIERSCDRINKLMEAIAAPFSELVIHRQLIDSGALLAEAIASVEDQAALKDVKIAVMSLADCKFYADELLMQKALSELLVNAVESMQQAGTINIHTHTKAERIDIAIEDEGAGIAPDDLANVFMPFFTTKERKRGLGLTEVLRIINAHNGAIDIKERAQGGTCVTLSLSCEKARP
jgi:signal transduction histidine kinase